MWAHKLGAVALAGLCIFAVACGGNSPRRAAETTTSESSTSPVPGTEPRVAPGPTPTHELVPAGPRARVVSSIPMRDQLVFVTIDDGFFRDPRVVRFIATHHWPVSAFIIDRVAQQAPGWVKTLLAAGATLEDHTYSHPQLPTVSYAEQQQQICRPTLDFPRLFAVHPILFRPPYGSYDDATRRAATACGFGTVIEWTATMFNGVLKIAFRRPVKAGDIILMHFVPSLYTDLQRLDATLAQAHLHVGRLESYVTGP